LAAEQEETAGSEEEEIASYEYAFSSFSLELMPPGRARFWLRFTPEQIRQLVPLLGLNDVAFRRRCTADVEQSLRILAARLSYPGR